VSYYMVAESDLIRNNCNRMPRNRFAKLNRRNKEENLYSEVDEAAVRPKTIPSPKLETVDFDYRNKLSEAEYNKVVRRNHTLGGYLDTRKLVEDLRRTKSDRQHPREAETDSSQETFKRPLPPRMRRLPTRNYTRIYTTPPATATRIYNTPPATPTRIYNTPPTPPRRIFNRPHTSPTRPSLRHTPPPALPNRYCKSYVPAPAPTKQQYRESYIYSVNTEEPTTLIGDKTRRVYAKIPEYSAVKADSHIRGKPGQIIYQTSIHTQTEDPWLSSFQRSFQDMKL
jgi:hypothetical protein